jgi:hypothetical protein
MKKGILLGRFLIREIVVLNELAIATDKTMYNKIKIKPNTSFFHNTIPI